MMPGMASWYGYLIASLRAALLVSHSSQDTLAKQSGPRSIAASCCSRLLVLLWPGLPFTASYKDGTNHQEPAPRFATAAWSVVRQQMVLTARQGVYHSREVY